MDRKTGMLIAFLVILSLGLAYNTVTQSLVRSQRTSKAAPAAGPPLEMPKAPAGASGEAKRPAPVPAFEAITVAKAAPKAKFVGEWINAKQDRRGLTRVTVARKSDGLTVTPWALHCTGEKPYGEAKGVGATASNPFELTWEAGYAESKMRLALLDDGRLRVDSVTVVMDPAGTKSPVVTDYFTKATPEALRDHKRRQAMMAAQLKKAEQLLKEPKPGGG